jgi:hypothetical protein
MTHLRPVPRSAAVLLLAGLAVLLALGLVVAVRPGVPVRSAPGNGDQALYAAVAARTPALGYYDAAVAEHRARGYPLRPVMTVREPALAWLTAALGEGGRAWAFRLLGLAAIAAVLWRLRGEGLAAAALAAVGLLLGSGPAQAGWHEGWAGLLLLVALACAGTRNWWIGCAAGLAAALFRELAAPALGLMMLFALIERRRTEAWGWAGALLLFAGAYALHAHAVQGRTGTGDLASEGWLAWGGWRAVLAQVRVSTPLILGPAAVTAAVVPLALLGWAAAPGGFARRVAATMAIFVVAFLAIGRADNLFWGLIWAPLLPAGLAWAPAAVRGLLRAARG